MTDPERWNQVKAIFDAALGKPPAERNLFLQENCNRDDDLYKEVQSLLSAHEKAGSFVERPLMESLDTATLRALDEAGHTLRRGDPFGPYEITDFVAAGGMGEVYRARDSKLRSDLAIKVLPSAFTSDAHRLARFEQEARSLAALNHSHVEAIFEMRESNGLLGLVLEFVEGETLSERLHRGSLPLTEALAIATQIADALDATHDKGIVHRDLKPANIKITLEGKVKVLDFGLAKTERADVVADPQAGAAKTADGIVLGTATYISPEQARGKATDKRTDIWSFGCVLFEMLTGKPPFARDTVGDTIAAILNSSPDWTALPPTTPSRIEEFLRRCLEKDVNHRLRDIGDARIFLEVSAFDHIADRNSSRVQTAGLRRLVATLAVLSLAGVAAVVLRTFVKPASPGAAEVTPHTAAAQITDYGGGETNGALSPDGRSFVFVSDHEGMTDIWLRNVSGGNLIRLTSDGVEESDLVYAPNGDSIFFTRNDSDGRSVWRIGALGGQPRKIVSDARMPAPSPDGLRLAYLTAANPADLEVVELNGNSRRTLVRSLNPGIQSQRPAPTWSPNGRLLAYNQWGLFAPHNLFIVDVETGSVRQVTQFTSSNDGIALQSWLPDNRHLAVVQTGLKLESGQLGILDTDDGSISRVTIPIAQTIDALSASADGTRVLATVSERRLEVWKVPLGSDPESNGRAAVRLLDSTYAPYWTFVSRDGGTLLLNGGVTGTSELWTMSLDGNASLRQITSSGNNVITHASLSPDGSRVAFASGATGKSKIWTQNIDGSDLRQLTSDDAADHWPVWSPDGQTIVFGSEIGGTIRETRMVSAAGSPTEKIIDGFFRGDWIRLPGATHTLLVSSVPPGAGVDGLRLIDYEQRKVLWERYIKGLDLTMPSFSLDGRNISLPVRESRDRHAILVFDTATGQSRTAVRFSEPFLIEFRAGWTDGGRALIVNRRQTNSHIVLFDRFWER
jgi:Tol biopolymer transport system component